MSVDPEILSLLSKCKLEILKDFTFGDAEYCWIDSDNNIVAEAYVSRNNATFHTCPPGYWVLHHGDPVSWSMGDDYDDSQIISYSGEDAVECSRVYNTLSLHRNDNG
jgi:hypothetical protein